MSSEYKIRYQIPRRQKNKKNVALSSQNRRQIAFERTATENNASRVVAELIRNYGYEPTRTNSIRSFLSLYVQNLRTMNDRVCAIAYYILDVRYAFDIERLNNNLSLIFNESIEEKILSYVMIGDKERKDASEMLIRYKRDVLRYISILALAHLDSVS